MKTRSIRIVPVTNGVPQVAYATMEGIQAFRLTTSRLTFLKSFIFLCSAFLTTVAFGQTITWTNTIGGNFGRGTNWSGGLPTTGTTCVFDGIAALNLAVFSQDGINGAGSGNPIGGSFGANGVNIQLTAGQTGSVTLYSPIASSVGMGFNGIQVDAGAGQLILGENNDNQLVCTLRPSSGLHAWVNNSTQPVIIRPSFQINNGGGSAGHMINFQGTGNFMITNNLRFNNGPTFTHNIQWDNTGTTYWAEGFPNGTGTVTNRFNNALGNVVINAGTLVITTPRLVPFTSGTGANTIQNNGTLLKFDFPGQSDTIARTISGASPIEQHGGTNTFSGANTYTGNTILSGGELIAGSAENTGSSGPLGTSGTISFSGGTLGFSAANTFDYSSRFDTSAGQQYRFDTAGLSVTFATGLTSSGGSLTKLNSGTLTLAAANTYSGATTVSGGKLVFQGSKSGSGSITLADSTSLSITATGTQVAPSTLTLGTSSGVTLEFNNITSTTTAPLAAGTIASGGTVTINISSGTFNTIGQSFPLITWTSGSAPAVALGALSGANGTLSTNGNSIQLNITATPYIWTGGNNGTWDTSTTGNWLQSGNPVTFANSVIALFDDSATGATNITISGVVQPASTIINNSSVAYTLTSSSGNNIGGTNSLTKNGTSTASLSGGANTYTGITTISGGTLSISNLASGGVASDVGAASSSAANLVLNGGTLQFLGTGASIDRLVSVGTAGGAIDNSGTGALALTNTGSLGLSGSGPRVFTLAGTDLSDNTFAANIGNSSGGATSLTKSGAGKWILTGTNTYSGVTTIANGWLQIGAGGGSGTLGAGNVVNNGRLTFNRTGTYTVSGTISGTGAVTNDGTGTVILPGNNTYSGGTTINAGTLQIGNGGSTGALDPNDPIVNNSLFIYNSTGTFNLGGAITGTGNVIIRGAGGTLAAIGGNTYTGWTLIDTNAIFQATRGNTGGGLLSSVVTNYGTLLLQRQDMAPAVFGYTNSIVGTGKVLKENNNQNEGWVVLAGTNTYTGGTWIAGGGIQFGDGITPFPGGTIVGPVIFTNTTSGNLNARRIIFSFPDDRTFTNNIITAVTDGSSAANSGILEQDGPGKVTITGNTSFPGGTVVNNGAVLQAGNGGTSGSIGSGNVTLSGTLIMNHSDNVTLTAVTQGTTGTGSLIQSGTGTLTLSASNSYTGPTIISNGTMIVSGRYLGGDLNVEGGTIAPAVSGTVATLNVAGNLTIDAGTVLITLNKSLSQSNSVILVTNEVTTIAGSLTANGGTLKLINAGPAVAVGEKFTIFSGPVTGGGSMTIVSPGFTVQNDLAVDGSVTVTALAPAPTLSTSVTGNQLTLSWPSTWTGGVHLQSQTNALSKGLSTNWVTIPGTDAANNYITTIVTTNPAVFYRLIAP